MTDRPIIFSGPMVRALLEGRKTQTRRVINGSHPASIFNPATGWEDDYILDPGNAEWRQKDIRYAVGDRLYVRENGVQFSLLGEGAGNLFAHDVPEQPHLGRYWVEKTRAPGASYNAKTITRESHLRSKDAKVRPAIHMPRWASRLTLTVTDVRVQRLGDITPADAIAEGIRPAANSQTIDCDTPNPCDGFRDLWNSLHGPAAWNANPWVVALTFTVEQRNIDAMPELRALCHPVMRDGDDAYIAEKSAVLSAPPDSVKPAE